MLRGLGRVLAPVLLMVLAGALVVAPGAHGADAGATQTVSGTVFGPEGEPVAGARVEVLANLDGARLATGATDSEGAYALTAPADVVGHLLVSGPAGYDTRFYDGAVLLQGSAKVTGPTLGAGSTGLVTTLGTPGRITGTLDVPDTVVGDRACVLALDYHRDTAIDWDCGEPGEDFAIEGLADGGSYRICVASDQGLAVPLCDVTAGAAILQTNINYSPPTTRVVVTAGADADVVLTWGAVATFGIRYRSFEDEDPFPGTCLSLETAAGEVFAESCEPDGRTFSLDIHRDLGPTTLNCCNSIVWTASDGRELLRTPHWYQYYGGRTMPTQYVWVDGPQIRGTLALAPEIEAATACVDLYGEDGVERSQCVEPGEPFAFELPRGEYALRVWSPDAVFADQWYDDGNPVDTGTAGVRLAIQVAAPAGVVEGRVSAPTGGPASGGCVTALTVDLAESWTACVDADGDYVLPVGAAGDLLFLFEGFDGLPDQWLGGTPTDEGSTAVAVSGTTNLDATLVAGGAIAGTVTGAPGISAGGAWADAYTLSGAWVTSAGVAADGTYVFPSLVPGSYRVRFESDDAAFAGGWARTSGQLVPRTVTVTSDATTAGVNRTFGTTAGRASVSGALNVPSGFTSATVCAVAVSSAGTAVAADCGARGAEFDLEPVRADGTVRVAFTDGKVTTAAQWAAFAGKVRWYGNAAASTAPKVAAAGTVSERLPVWFFSDVTTSVKAWRSIQWMGDAGISRGYANGAYRPFATTSRDALAAFMYRAAGSPVIDESDREPFTDVSSDPASPRYNEHWRAIAWMAQSGLSTGYQTKAGAEYRPLAQVTRDAIAAFLYRAEGSPEVQKTDSRPFLDVSGYPSADNYSQHATAITWMAQSGLSTGWAVYGGREYRPTAALTRDAIAVFLDKWTSLEG